MRATLATVAPLAAALLSSCSTTTLAEPRILVSPYLALYQIRGDVGVQSQPAPNGPLQDNAPQSLRTFGQDHYREDIGVRADIGDGFAGIRIDYYNLDQNTSKSGTLGADWGRLLAGDEVRMRAKMDELRIGYLENVATMKSTLRDQPLTFRFAAGGVLTWRDLDLQASTVDNVRSQNVEIDGEVLSVAGRFRAAWRDWAFDAEYAISPELTLGGDFEGLPQDLELRLAYTLAMHDVTFFGGYRFTTFEAEGQADQFRYDADLTIDGFMVGVSVTF
jgi:hypothetical protein